MALSNVIRPFINYGKQVASTVMSPAARQVQEGLKLYQNQPKPKPRANPYGTFKAPAYTGLSDADALQKAQDRLRPMYEQTRQQLGVDTQQQANLLRQRMNQVGQMGGGAEREGNINLVSGLQNALANADTAYNTNAAQLQQDLIDRDREEKARQIAQGLQIAQFNRGAMEADRAYDRGVLESDRGFNYQQGRDKLDDSWKERQWHRDLVLDNRAAAQDVRNFNRGILESDRNYNRGVLESDRSFNRGALESDRNYNRGVYESDRDFTYKNSGTDGQDFAKIAADQMQGFVSYVDKIATDSGISDYNKGWLKDKFNKSFSYYASLPNGYEQWQKDKAVFNKQHPGQLSQVFIPSMDSALMAISPYGKK